MILVLGYLLSVLYFLSIYIHMIISTSTEFLSSLILYHHRSEDLYSRVVSPWSGLKTTPISYILNIGFQVECVFTRDILSLCSAKNFAQTTFKTGTPVGAYTLPIFLGGEHKIWGLTAVMLHQTLNLIAPGMYKNKLRHPRTVGKFMRNKPPW